MNHRFSNGYYHPFCLLRIKSQVVNHSCAARGVACTPKHTTSPTPSGNSALSRFIIAAHF